ncbi:helix-turn-helix transcriptional regulator [Dictyobacter formicarum]|uniref:HTH arsR-type domain-containing protein n=1 Tax=Dictyobacter formicarum TaxID=2778368 RepID=A0ABQ3VH11_9CHLR|nr:ArsR family transcriptional regulator [Dictyobacter formicarum]GHO84746.1 hypothetical protein KSZ_27520 [Dictyobacter formicarum]
MSILPLNHHFFASTRGRIVLLLRRSSHTVDELAQDLDLTDNAVRAHLATLERDGLVRQSGARRGSGKPALVYALTSEAEQLFPKAYASVLQQLLAVLSSCMPTEKVEEVMQETGRRLATQWNIAPGELRARLQDAVALLNELGGLAELEEDDESYIIQGYSCPLAAIVPNHPEVCKLAQALLTELICMPVAEQCEQSGVARCRFTTAKI